LLEQRQPKSNSRQDDEVLWRYISATSLELTNAMQCLACGAEMRLEQVAGDDMPVPGFEHRTFMCSACRDIERRLVFTRDVGSNNSGPVPLQARPVQPRCCRREMLAASSSLHDPRWRFSNVRCSVAMRGKAEILCNHKLPQPCTPKTMCTMRCTSPNRFASSS
jgi:hypothetical protein